MVIVFIFHTNIKMVKTIMLLELEYNYVILQSKRHRQTNSKFFVT
jgi:hypothetical protein